MFFSTFFTPAIAIVLFNSVIFALVMGVLYKRPFAANRYVTGKEKRALIRKRKEVFGIISLTALLGKICFSFAPMLGYNFSRYNAFLFTFTNH